MLHSSTTSQCPNLNPSRSNVPWHRGIRRRLLVWGLTLLGGTLISMTIANSIFSRREIQKASAQLQAEIAATTASHIQSFISRKIERLKDTALSMSLYAVDAEQQRLISQVLLANDPSIREVSLINRDGMEILKLSEKQIYLPSDLKNLATQAPFVQAIRGKTFMGPVKTSTQAEPYLSIALPLKHNPPKPSGVLLAEVDLRFLWEEMARAKFGRGGFAYLVDQAGFLIGHPDPSRILQASPLNGLKKVQQFLSTRSLDPTPGEEVKGINDVKVLSTFASVPELGWGVIVEEPVELALAGLARLQRFSAVLLIVGLVLSTIVMLWVSKRITKPIQELRESVMVIGGGNLNHRSHIETRDEIQDLATEFNKMTIALQHSYATLEQKVAQRTKEVSALYSVTTAVNESLALNDILNAIIAKTIETFHFESIRVFLFNDERDALKLQASYATDPEHDTAVRTHKRGQGVIGHVTEIGEPMIFEDVKTDPRYAELSVTQATVNANLGFFAAIPIKTQSRVFGAILFSAQNPRKLAHDETRLLTAMSEHLAVAVEKASLFRESEKRAQQLSVLNSIGEAVNQSLNLDMVLTTAVNKMTEVLSFDASWIYMMDPSGEIFDLKAHNGIDAETVRALARKDNLSGVTEMIFQSGERLVSEDLNDESRDKERPPEISVLDLRFASTAGFPIKAKDKVIGVLHLASKAKHHFALDELQLIESITQEIGVAADNARLFEQVHSKTEELSRTNKELDQANQAKSEFISAMSHELRTPLNVIMGNAELTGDGFWGPINDEQKNSMEKIRHHARFLLKLVNDVLALSRLDAKKMSLELSTVEIDDVLVHVQGHVEQLNRSKRLEVNWDVDPDLPTITSDETKLEEILQNLIGNAFKFTPRGQINLRVKNLPEKRCIEFCVADSGIGIESQDMERIFTAFEQIREAHTGEFNGVGLGLSIVKNYLNLMNGDILVESRPGEGTTFTFTVPHSIPVPS